MSETAKKIAGIVLEKCEQHKKNPEFGYYDYWNDHIKRVVYHSTALAEKCGADAEITLLGALLHDISMPAEYGDRSEHHIYSAQMADDLLSALGYPRDRLERVKSCVLNHPGRNRHLRTSIEEACIADADALAHFDRIPSLFSLAYSILHMGLEEGRQYVKDRLEGDFQGLSGPAREMHGQRIRAIMDALFVD